MIVVMLLTMQAAQEPMIVIPQSTAGTRRPSCPPEPCVTIRSKQVVHLGWFVDGDEARLSELGDDLRSRGWTVPAPWIEGKRYRTRIMSDYRTPAELTALDKELRTGRYRDLKFELLTLPSIAKGK